MDGLTAWRNILGAIKLIGIISFIKRWCCATYNGATNQFHLGEVYIFYIRVSYSNFSQDWHFQETCWLSFHQSQSWHRSNHCTNNFRLLRKLLFDTVRLNHCASFKYTVHSCSLERSLSMVNRLTCKLICKSLSSAS